MQIVTDRWVDLSPKADDKLDIHLIPTVLNLGETTYSDESVTNPQQFYDALMETEALPTSQLPAADELAAFYRELAAQDPEILSIHVSSGINPVVELAREAARIAREANVTVVDTRAISLTQGWQVESAAWAVERGWPIGRIQSLLDRIRKASRFICALSTYKYRGHERGIASVKSRLGSLLGLRPVISVAGSDGRFIERSQANSSSKAIARTIDWVGRVHKAGSELRMQLGHTGESEELETVRERLSAAYACHWEPDCALSAAVAAQIGPGAVAVAFAPWESFSSLDLLETPS